MEIVGDIQAAYIKVFNNFSFFKGKSYKTNLWIKMALVTLKLI